VRIFFGLGTCAAVFSPAREIHFPPTQDLFERIAAEKITLGQPFLVFIVIE
jgi:hypothetical protein